MTAPLDVRVERAGAAARITVAGELDVATADRLRDALNSELDSTQQTIVNLEECSFIDSVGLSVLIAAAQQAGHTLAIASPSAAVRRLVEITQLDSLIPVFDSEAEALAGLDSSEALAD
jgi:anti-anti-sigma factor